MEEIMKAMTDSTYVILQESVNQICVKQNERAKGTGEKKMSSLKKIVS